MKENPEAKYRPSRAGIAAMSAGLGGYIAGQIGFWDAVIKVKDRQEDISALVLPAELLVAGLAVAAAGGVREVVLWRNKQKKSTEDSSRPQS